MPSGKLELECRVGLHSVGHRKILHCANRPHKELGVVLNHVAKQFGYGADLWQRIPGNPPQKRGKQVRGL